ncbi:MAG: hypothetical protein GF401_12610 [Chitinivibrionales bacterium]|nr:hypothetical protein [Chitinivibrionales bacterium]
MKTDIGLVSMGPVDRQLINRLKTDLEERDIGSSVVLSFWERSTCPIRRIIPDDGSIGVALF